MSRKSADPPTSRHGLTRMYRSETMVGEMPDAMGAGVKLKMPVGLLGHVSRAQNQLEALRQAGGVESVVVQAILKFGEEVNKLRAACEAVSPVDDEQRKAKEAWMAKNLEPKERVLRGLQSILPPEPPEELENEVATGAEGDDGRSVRSRSSRSSGASSASRLARAEAAAKMRMLEEEREHRRQQRHLEEQERRLRQQREDEELEQQIRKAHIMQEELENERSPPPSLAVPWNPHLQPREGQARPSGTTFAPNMGTEGLLQHVLLPQSTLPMFKGDHLEFLWFMNAFEMRVEAVTADPGRRLHLLIQHLEGDARKLVMGCQLAQDPAAGYMRAKSKLMTKYGNRVRQGLAFKEQLLAWPCIKKDSAAELERFSIQLQLCEEVKMAGGLGELDAAGTILQLMLKLPVKLQEAWQMKVCKVEATQLREANFHDFSQFVEERAAARNHPVYGTKRTDLGPSELVRPAAKSLVTATDPEETVGATITTNTASQSTTVTTSSAASGPTTATMSQAAPPDASRPPCLLCTGNHATSKCKAYSALPLPERRSRLKGLCFACLKPGHTARQCGSKGVCEKCKGPHPLILHDDRDSQGEDRSKHNEGLGTEKAAATQTACLVSSSPRVAVAVVPVHVWCGQQADKVTVKAILDPGSTATFVSDELVKRLGLEPQDTALRLTTMATTGSKLATRVVPGLRVMGLDQNEIVALPPAYTVAHMPFEAGDLACERDAQSWDHLGDVPFNWRPETPIEMLIGMNAPRALKPLQVVGGGADEPYALKTALGWCFNGPLRRRDQSAEVVANLLAAEEVKIQLEAMYFHDFGDAFDFRTKGPSQEDQEWIRQVSSSIRRAADSSTGQYEIALPLRQNVTRPDNNRKQALQRLSSLARKFANNATFHRDYTQFIKKMEDQGYVEEVPATETADPTAFYIPHHGVYHPRKPGKIRVVFNCSNKFGGRSINDCLLQGPDLTNSLLGVLLRFRQQPVAFMADIESMFYRVRIPQKHRDCLRYLWWPGGEVSQPVKTYRMTVHVFGATSSPSCASFALRRAADDAREAGLVSEEVCQAVKDNFYVDDCLKAMPDVESAIKMARGLVEACASGGFKLTKFVSSNVEFLRALPPDSLATGIAEVDLSSNKADPLGEVQERALGVTWNVAQDTFKMAVTETRQQAAVTKRNVLSTLSTIYDPIGMAAPVLIVARVFFRNLTMEKKLGWDDTVEGRKEELQGWTEWLQALPLLTQVSIPRCFNPEGRVHQWELHVFCDASEKAYAAAVYLRGESEEGPDPCLRFVTGKARVTPPKVVTIPRLELVAAKLATDLAVVVEGELQLDISRRVFWTDSQTVLKYLSNKVRRFHTFVANRVAAILTVSQVDEWRYVPSELNPADEGSRGVAAGALNDGAWVKGPPFLRQHESLWPVQPGCDGVAEDDPEVHTLLVKQEPLPADTFVEMLAKRYSEASKVRHAVRVWLSFIRYLQQRSKGPPTRAEVWANLKTAELATIRGAQRSWWAREMETMQQGSSVPSGSALRKLSPQLTKEGLIVMDGRTRVKLPIISGSSWLGELIVREAHQQQAHLGRQSTAAATGRHYWVVGLQKLVRRVVRACPACQRRTATPVVPRMGPLPDYRLKGHHAFEHTGVDYFGPFHVVQGRGQIKVYGVIFSCAVTRAVHLEVAGSLSGSDFLNALRRFIARRGHVRHLISDNGTNFVGANAELKKETMAEIKRLRQEEGSITRALNSKFIEWSFNPPDASHHGGFWERLIRMVRQTFMAMWLNERPLTLEGMITLMCEIEAVLNNRPLTPLSDDPQDFEPLTPNHLLLGREGPQVPPGDFDDKLPPLQTQWRRVQHMATQFWQRWTNEYKVLLLQRPKWHADPPSLQVEDVVLVMDKLQPREYWPLGRVSELHPGDDGRVRVVTVRTHQNDCLKWLKRPVTKVCRLEAATEAWRRC